MECMHEHDIPVSSGGLGGLAGCMGAAARDRGLRFIIVSNAYTNGYFEQHFGSPGDDNPHWQRERYPRFDFAKDPRFVLEAHVVRQFNEGREFDVGAFRYNISGNNHMHPTHVIPAYHLTTDFPGNQNEQRDRDINSHLYGGDKNTRIRQEIVLGMAGRKMVRALGYNPTVTHLNEGHGGFDALQRLLEGMTLEDIRESTIFTSHTPVPAGWDIFKGDLVQRVLNGHIPATILDLMENLAGPNDLNMTKLTMNTARYTNGVSKLHAEVMREHLVPHRRIHAITNGTHTYRWAGDEMAAVFDTYLPEWRQDPSALGRASVIPDDAIERAHQAQKSKLIDFVNANAYKRTASFDDDALTIGIARRFATYKRASLILRDPDRLRHIAAQCPGGVLQIVYGGKAHPHDDPGKQLIKEVLDADLGPTVRIAFVQNYQRNEARLMTGGADYWGNTPVRGEEACGTSGQKALINGVPSLSVKDGWTDELQDGDAYLIPGAMVRPPAGGWHNDAHARAVFDARAAADARDLYDVLEHRVVPDFRSRERRIAMAKKTIALHPDFSADRMLRDYVRAYGLTLEDLQVDRPLVVPVGIDLRTQPAA
jgi:starch phosphorylase